MRRKHSPAFRSLTSFNYGFLSLALAACALCGATRAQSGRRAPKSNLPPSPPVTTTTIPDAAGESESVPRGSVMKGKPAQLSLAVLEIESPFLNTSYIDTDLIIASFVKRLSDSAMLSVRPGGKTDRKAARDRAKNETDTHVVAVELDEDSMNGRGSIGRVDPATLILKYYIYMPRTGSLKRQGRVDQRPYSGSTRIGRVRVPLPTPRGRVTQDYVLEQLGRDAADRVMAAFSVIPPPG